MLILRNAIRLKHLLLIFEAFCETNKLNIKVTPGRI